MYHEVSRTKKVSQWELFLVCIRMSLSFVFVFFLLLNFMVFSKRLFGGTLQGGMSFPGKISRVILELFDYSSIRRLHLGFIDWALGGGGRNLPDRPNKGLSA
jgi:hypothetical protein